MKTTLRNRARWMQDFEALAVRADYYEAGKVCWDTARFLYNQNITVVQAVDQLLGCKPEDTDYNKKVTA